MERLRADDSGDTHAPGERFSVAGICRVDDRYFVAKRVSNGVLGGKWEFPGGKLEEGETPEQALAREYGEEFGAAINVGAFLGQTTFANGTKKYRLLAYSFKFVEPPRNHPDHEETAWVSREELDRLDLADSDRGIVPYLD